MDNNLKILCEKILDCTIDKLLPLVDLFDSEEEFMECFINSILVLEIEELKDKAKTKK
ncbi:MAG TPA: hypothetical protein PLD18_08655 [Flavobacterium sp.]|nr:hypothetical protein [Flavobacterium sp.]HRA72307.1 hypothetical protein [Flavobacterium sp.]